MIPKIPPDAALYDFGPCTPACKKEPVRAAVWVADFATSNSANLSGRLSDMLSPRTSRAFSNALSAELVLCRFVSDCKLNKTVWNGRGPTPISPCNTSYFIAAERSNTRKPEISGPFICKKLPPWCFSRTPTAFRKLVMVCTKSVSVSRNSAAAFSRIAVAFLSEAVSSAICFFSASMVATRDPTWALRCSISAIKSLSLASASATAFVFSFSFVSHQQTILSYISDSLLASFSSSAFIFFKRLTTRLMGLTPVPLEDKSCEQAKHKGYRDNLARHEDALPTPAVSFDAVREI